ncbi:MAG: LytTR family DNA-binding domain-containing protein [Bacteroidota bacterium]
MIRAIVIEDEINNRELLVNLLVNYCTGIEVVGTAEDVNSGIQLVKTSQPDLVFLDIEMPDGDGFDLLDACAEQLFKVVFVTGYDHYAIRAIKYAALDYLVKPINFEELNMVIQRFNYHQIDQNVQRKVLHNTLSRPLDEANRIVVTYKNEQAVVGFDEILYLQAHDRYVSFFLEGPVAKMAVHTLTHYEALLPSHHFVRIHKSYLVNLAKVSHYDAGRLGNLYLFNGESLPIAARRKTNLINRWQAFQKQGPG